MKRSKHNNFNSSPGFTIVELIGVVTIIAILCTISIIPVLRIIEEAKVRAERANLALLAAEVKTTFSQENLQDFNISSLPGEIPTAVPPGGTPISATFFEKAFFEPDEPGRAFYNGTEAYEPNAWYAKLARLRGQNDPGGSPLLRDTSGQVREIALNNYNRRRIMIVGPCDEPHVQRYIILSFAFPLSAGNNFVIANSTAAMDGYQGWFDRIYDHDWGVATTAPTDWAGDWGVKSSGGKTYAQRVLVQRIVQRRYEVTINNTSSSPHYFVDMYTNMESVGNAATALNNNSYAASALTNVFKSGNPMSPRGILEGRRVLAYRLDGGGTRHLMYSFLINENTTVTLQDR